MASPYAKSIKELRSQKKISRILIIVITMITMMIIVIVIIIIIIIIIMTIIRSNKKSIDKTLTWGHRFDDILERSAVYYFKDELSVAILAIDLM